MGAQRIFRQPYLKKFLTPDSPEFDGLPKPAGLTFAEAIDLGKATLCYSKEVLREDNARQDYEFLSELSHPNSGAINHYLRFELQKNSVHFSKPAAERDNWDSYVLKYAARAGMEIVELINLAKEIDPSLNEKP